MLKVYIALHFAVYEMLKISHWKDQSNADIPI